jgi:hypothetical protein
MRELRKKRKNRELRGVGRNMQDHFGKSRLLPDRGRPDPNECPRDLPLAGEFILWLITGKGMLTHSSRCWRSRPPPTCNARLPRAASRAAGSANSMRRPARAAGAW